MYNLFIDDYRFPEKIGLKGEWVIVRNYNDFVKYITKNNLPEKIAFDHDLSIEDQLKTDYNQFTEKTGYHAAKWLIEYCMETNQPLPEYSVHSMNPVGKQNIIQLLNNFKKIQDKTDYK